MMIRECDVSMPNRRQLSPDFEGGTFSTCYLGKGCLLKPIKLYLLEKGSLLRRSFITSVWIAYRVQPPITSTAYRDAHHPGANALLYAALLRPKREKSDGP
jgi:hypothetical protein